MANEKRLIDATRLEYWIDGGIHGAEVNGNAPTVNLYDVLTYLDGMPTVDAVEVVHGRWIDNGGLDEDGNGQYRCSCCGVGEKHNPTVTVPYCWKCGAKMDGDGNG